MRIFIGLTDVANVTANYTKGFRALGHHVNSAVWNKSYFYPDENYSLVIDNRKPGEKSDNKFLDYINIAINLVRLVLQSVDCDLFIMYAPAVLPTHLYYPLLKILGKDIITVFWGSDIRYWYALAEEMKSYNVQDEMSPLFEYAKSRSGGSYWDKKRTISVAEKYSDLILSQPDYAQLQSQPYMRCQIPLDLSEYKFSVPGRTNPLILHAPSVPEAKGTDIVLKVIEELKEEGLQFEFRLIEKMPNRDLRKLLTESDIVVDQLFSSTIAGFAAEAMATGNAVIARYMEEYTKVPAGCPAINANKFTLKNKLREIILDVNMRKTLAERGRPYVEMANDNIRVCNDILYWFGQKENLTYDFYPTFHKSLHLPSSLLSEERKETARKRSDFFRGLISTGTTKRK